MTTKTCTIKLRTPHERQLPFVTSATPRIIVRAGRRGGKTVGVSIKAAKGFLDKRRVLYAAPTSEQLDAFWFEIKRSFAEAIANDYVTKNETDHIIEIPGTKQRIRAKTAWNADTLRGDYADLLILDEWQLMDENAWEEVGQPMLLDNNGQAVFIYTPPSLHSRSVSKSRDVRHAARMFARAKEDTTGRWEAYHFTSAENPYISREALGIMSEDMTSLAYRQEILAEDIDEVPGALWKRQWLDEHRTSEHPHLARIVVGVDPAVTSNETSDETGILVAGIGDDGHGYVLADGSGHYSPDGWARRSLSLLESHAGDRIIAEDNNGGELVESTLRTIDPSAPITRVHASRGKAARAEPVAALYEQGKVHHVGNFGALEDQLCSWEPLSTRRSPDRLDALVWALSSIMFTGRPNVRFL